MLSITFHKCEWVNGAVTMCMCMLSVFIFHIDGICYTVCGGFAEKGVHLDFVFNNISIFKLKKKNLDLMMILNIYCSSSHYHRDRYLMSVIVKRYIMVEQWTSVYSSPSNITNYSLAIL